MTSTFPPVAQATEAGRNFRVTPRRRPVPYVEIFILFQFACQLALLTGGAGSIRSVFRIASFGCSVLMLLIVPGRRKTHPAGMVARWVIGIVAVALLHPSTNSWLSGIAEVVLYLAILAPLFWVSRLEFDAARLRRLFLILWAFHSVSAGIGVLQVIYPGHFKTNLSTAVSHMGKNYVSDLYMRTASGERVFRPMGLTDVPGGAATSGFYAALLGVALLLTERKAILKALYFASLLLGTICIYLSQVRMTLVMLGICLAALCCVLVWRGERAKLLVLAVLLPGVVIVSFTLSVAIGGRTVTRRVETLLKGRPSEVYYKNRGFFLDHTVKNLLPKYPFGAGLGRWGMVYQYFGNKADPAKGLIYVEIMWTGWLLDGGVPLILLYVTALGLAFLTAIRVTLIREGDLWLAGAILVAYNVGALAATFVSCFFIGQSGMELWLLNAALFAAARGDLQRAKPALRRAFHPPARPGYRPLRPAPGVNS